MEVNKIHEELLMKRTKDALERNGFKVECFKTKEEASQHILSTIKPGDKVGFGGSMTIKSMGMQQKVRDLGATVLDHGDASLTVEEKLEVMRQQLTSDVFLCSSNAVTMEEGEVINIDGTGNRIAAMTFGPKKVFIVVGVNKICLNESHAFHRLKEIACPQNNIRLNTENPCTKTGICVDCKSGNRICNIYSIFKRKPGRTDISIIIVGDTLGY